jgi:hypothetical protein
MIALWILGVVVVIAIATWAAVKWGPEPYFDDRVYPECMTCNKESCVGCPLVEARRRNLK